MLTPAQRLWVDVFGPRQNPCLREEKVLEMVNSLPDRRERLVLHMRCWEGKSMRAIGEAVLRSDGQTGVSREMARRILAQGLTRLRHPARRALWEEARDGGGMDVRGPQSNEVASALNKDLGRR